MLQVSKTLTGISCTTLAKMNISYSILFNLTTSYSSYFGGKKGISRNKTSFFLLMNELNLWDSKLVLSRGCQEGWEWDLDRNGQWLPGLDTRSARKVGYCRIG